MGKCSPCKDKKIKIPAGNLISPVLDRQDLSCPVPSEWGRSRRACSLTNVLAQRLLPQKSESVRGIHGIIWTLTSAKRQLGTISNS
jgi:hypothetical protein